MENYNIGSVNSYLSFKLGKEEFASHVSKVLNILEMTKITEIPKAPEYMKGVINLRGRVLPVIDTRIKFGMEETQYTDKTCIIVMELNVEDDKIYVGGLVDEVMAVLEIDDSQIEPPPSIGNKYRSEFIDGMAKVDERFVILLNMENVFTSDDIEILKENNVEEVISEK